MGGERKEREEKKGGESNRGQTGSKAREVRLCVRGVDAVFRRIKREGGRKGGGGGVVFVE
jgi:hypothetical protein